MVIVEVQVQFVAELKVQWKSALMLLCQEILFRLELTMSKNLARLPEKKYDFL